MDILVGEPIAGPVSFLRNQPSEANCNLQFLIASSAFCKPRRAAVSYCKLQLIAQCKHVPDSNLLNLKSIKKLFPFLPELWQFKPG